MAKISKRLTPAEKELARAAVREKQAVVAKESAAEVAPQVRAQAEVDALAKARGERAAGAQEYIGQVESGNLSGSLNTEDSEESFKDLTPDRYPNAVSHNPSYHNELYGHIAEIRSRLRTMGIDNASIVTSKSGQTSSRVKLQKSTIDTVNAVSRHLDLAAQSIDNSISAHKAGGTAAITAVGSFSKATDHIHDAITVMRNRLGTRNGKYISTDQYGQGYAALGGPVETRLSALVGAYATHVAGSVNHPDYAYEISQAAEQQGVRNYRLGEASPSYVPPRQVVKKEESEPTAMGRSATDSGATTALTGGSLRFDVTRNPVRTVSAISEKPDANITSKVGEALDRASDLRAEAAVKEGTAIGKSVDAALAEGSSITPKIPYNSTANMGDPNHPVRLRLARDVAKALWTQDPDNEGKTFIGSEAHADPYAYHLLHAVKQHFLKQSGNSEENWEGSDAQRFPESYKEAWSGNDVDEKKRMEYRPPVEESFVLRRMAESAGIPLKDLPTKSQSEDAERYGGDTVEDVATAKEKSKIAEERASGAEIDEATEAARVAEAAKKAPGAQLQASAVSYGAQAAAEAGKKKSEVKHDPIRDENVNLANPGQTAIKFSDDTKARMQEAEENAGGPLEHEDIVDLLNPEERRAYEEHDAKMRSPETEDMEGKDNLDEIAPKGGRSSAVFNKAATSHLEETPLGEEK